MFGNRLIVLSSFEANAYHIVSSDCLIAVTHVVVCMQTKEFNGVELMEFYKVTPT